LQERLDEDPQFALSISQPHIDGLEDKEDNFVDGSIFDNDLAISADDLVDGLTGNTSADKSQIDDPESLVMGFDEDNNFIIHGGLDDKLTDTDTEGETDPEFDQDMNGAKDIKWKGNGVMEIDSPGMDNSGESHKVVACDSESSLDSEDEFADPYVLPVISKVLPSLPDRHFVDVPEGR
jgi:hypothetical protein